MTGQTMLGESGENSDPSGHRCSQFCCVEVACSRARQEMRGTYVAWTWATVWVVSFCCDLKSLTRTQTPGLRVVDRE